MTVTYSFETSTKEKKNGEKKIESKSIVDGDQGVMIKFLKKDSKTHYLKFKEYLDLLKIPYIEDHTLV